MTLIGWVIALCAVIVAEVAALSLLLTTPPAFRVPEDALLACDTPLLTPEEREQARRTNVGSYTFDGIYYVNASLPEEYWTEWRSA